MQKLRGKRGKEERNKHINQALDNPLLQHRLILLWEVHLAQLF